MVVGSFGGRSFAVGERCGWLGAWSLGHSSIRGEHTQGRVLTLAPRGCSEVSLSLDPDQVGERLDDVVNNLIRGADADLLGYPLTIDLDANGDLVRVIEKPEPCRLDASRDKFLLDLRCEVQGDVALCDDSLLGAHESSAMIRVEDVYAAATRARMDWLEDVLAGLLANGVRIDDVEVQEHPGNRTVVVVRGTPRYEWSVRFDDDQAPVSHARTASSNASKSS